MKIKYYISIIFVSFLFSNCEKDSESDLSKPIPTIVKYTTSIKPIMDNNCKICHDGSTATPYLNYQQTKNAISNILSRIQKDQADSQVMPQGAPKLSQADINLILKWQADGLLE